VCVFVNILEDLHCASGLHETPNYNIKKFTNYGSI